MHLGPRPEQNPSGIYGIANGATGGGFQVVLSDTSPTFEEVAERFLGRRIPDIELVSV